MLNYNFPVTKLYAFAKTGAKPIDDVKVLGVMKSKFKTEKRKLKS